MFLATTDGHGSIFPYDFLNKKPHRSFFSPGGLIALCTLRKDPDNEIVYIDMGSYYQGQPVIYYYNFLYEGKNPGATILNYLQPTAAGGNHDIETGPQIYDKLVQQMKFLYLWLANILRMDNQPYQ